MALSRLKSIDKATKSTCHGYVRENGRLITWDTNIPMLVTSLITLYSDVELAEDYIIEHGIMRITSDSPVWVTHPISYPSPSSNYKKVIHRIKWVQAHKYFRFGYIDNSRLSLLDKKERLGRAQNKNISSSYFISTKNRQIVFCDEMSEFSLFGLKHSSQFKQGDEFVITLNFETDKIYIECIRNGQSTDLGLSYILYDDISFGISLTGNNKVYIDAPVFENK